MNRISIPQFIGNAEVILGEGAVIERIKRESDKELDPYIISFVLRPQGTLLANTAALEPEALDNSENLVAEEPEKFGRDIARLKNEFGLKILGGCCGTDERHIKALADNLKT